MSFFDAITLWISLKTAISATLIASFTGFFAAAFIVGKQAQWSPRLISLIDTVLIAPMILPPTVIGFGLLLLLGANSPLGELWEGTFGDPLVFSWPATVVAASTVAFPLMYRTTRAALQQIDKQQIAAARTLTASAWQIYRKVILPAAWPGVLAGMLLAFARSLGEFGATLMLAGSIPGKTRTIPMTIYFAVESGQYAEAMFWSVLIMVISLVVIFAAELPTQVWTSARTVKKTMPSPEVLPKNGLALHIAKELNNFTLELNLRSNSQRLAILGASGSGKSWLLRCLAGLEAPDQGWIVVEGELWFDRQKKLSLEAKKRQTGLLLQNYALFPHVSVRENIMFGMAKPSPALADRWLEKIGLRSLAEERPTKLSGGQQQRIALARALAAQPKLLLLDEPFTALDAHLRDQLEQQLSADLLHFPGRLMLVTHNVDEAWRLCDEVILLEKGRIIRQGPKKAVFEDPQTVSAAQLTACKNVAEVSAIHGSKVRVESWNCEFAINAAATPVEFIGIRAHHIELSPAAIAGENIYTCWLGRMSESPHRITFFIKLAAEPKDEFDATIQVILPRERAETMLSFPQPWYASFPRQRILLLRKSVLA